MREHSTFLVAGVAVAGGLMFLRHYIRLITEPFADCAGVFDYIAKLQHMDDARFLGVLMGAIFLLVYVLEIMWPLVKPFLWGR